MVHVITYDLRAPNDTGQYHERVISLLKSHFAIWARLEKSAWLVETQMSASQVRDTLMSVMQATDVVFVARLTPEWASAWLDKERVDWLKGRTF